MGAFSLIVVINLLNRYSMDISNLASTKTDQAFQTKEEGTLSLQQNDIHIRIQQRNGRKTLTTIQGLSDKWDMQKMVRFIKKVFACNGTVINHSEYGQVIQLQGDKRSQMLEFLTVGGFATREQVKVHGF